MRKLIQTLVVLAVMQSATALAAGQYVEALRCFDLNKEELGDANAAVLCRGVLSATATATYNCLGYASDRDLNAAQKAMLCQGTAYAILSATLNCFDQAAETMSADAAARLCQKTSYAVYTTKFNCVAHAMDMMDAGAAAELCGGIVD